MRLGLPDGLMAEADTGGRERGFVPKVFAGIQDCAHCIEAVLHRHCPAAPLLPVAPHAGDRLQGTPELLP